MEVADNSFADTILVIKIGLITTKLRNGFLKTFQICFGVLGIFNARCKIAKRTDVKRICLITELICCKNCGSYSTIWIENNISWSRGILLNEALNKRRRKTFLVCIPSVNRAVQRFLEIHRRRICARDVAGRLNSPFNRCVIFS